MTFTTVLLACTAAIAACAVLVFVVETVVAFWLGDDAGNKPVLAAGSRLEPLARAEAEKRAA